MYAPHFGTALAIKTREPQAPLWALLIGAFLPDVLWIVLPSIGVEPTQQFNFFDDWSHSFVSVVILANLFALPFLRTGKGIAVAVWLSVFSHFLLDFPVHPKRLALYPLSYTHLGWDLLAWRSRSGWLGAINDWWLQLIVLLLLLIVYVQGVRRMGISLNVVAASCILLLGVQLLALSSCISYRDFETRMISLCPC